MYVLSANSTSQQQWAPTCLIDPDGNVVNVAALNKEYLLMAEIEITEPGFSRQGRVEVVYHWSVLLRVWFLSAETPISRSRTFCQLA
jgi:hypothetical protein